ncbi:MAG: EAL domain-containing protein [Pseudomonadota bacterium]|nr:EAL domain-containing protein [Pseudomonadota bacterium]
MNWNVLYAEDDRVQSAIVLSLLQQDGFTVTHVENGKAALAALSGQSYDVILTDQYMPQMSGFELLSEVRKRELDIPLILMTSTQDMQLVFAAVRAGAADFISKDLNGQYLELIAPVLVRSCERHQLQARLRQHAARLEQEKNLCYKTLDAMEEGVIVINEDLCITYHNSYFSALFPSGTEGCLLGKRVAALIALFNRQVEREQTDGALLDEGAFCRWLKSGAGSWEMVVGTRILDVKKVEVAGTGFAVALADISQRKEAEQALIRAHQLTQSIIDHSPFSIVATDLNGIIVAVSPALERMLDYHKDELVQQRSVLMFHDEAELIRCAQTLSDELDRDIDPNFDMLVLPARNGEVRGQDWNYTRKDGTRVPVNVTVTTLRDHDGRLTGYLWVAYDVTAQRQAAERIQHVAHHDALTGLPNRTLLQDRLETALRRVRRTGRKMGVLVLDLDHFKRINDSLGHVVGDELLKTVATRLVVAVRDSDTVCRMGGDEFVVILPDVHLRQDVERICLKILESVARPVQVGLNTLTVTPSIGLSMAPDDGDNEADLLKHADIAMYRAKQSGRNGYSVFCQEMAQVNHDEMMIEQALHHAFHHRRLKLHYQPRVDVETRRVNGFEALIRWHDPVHGTIAPDRFIPMAETTGYILSLGAWALQQACRDIRTLREQHGVAFRVSVNVSPRQLEQPDFVDTVRNALQASGLPPQALELEITEGVLAAESGAVLTMLNALHDLGVVLAIDDFGTGYCSLAYLAQYPIDVIKIDRSFLDVGHTCCRAIVGAITSIAEELGLEVVAEGVETQDQIELVRDRGCRVVQGYYFYEALALEDLTPLLPNVSRDVARKLAMH